MPAQEQACIVWLKGKARQGRWGRQRQGKRSDKERQSKAGGEGKAKAREKGRKGKAGEEGRKGKAKARRCDELTLCCAAATSSLTAFMTATLYMA